MYRILKVLHLIGLTLFLGSVLGHVVASALGGEPGTAGFLFSRAHIVAATRIMTMPGLGLTILTGIGMALVGRISPLRERWLGVKGVLALLILLNAVILVVPAGAQALAGALALSHNEAGAAAAGLPAALQLERVAGAANILLTLAIIVLGVFQPALGARSRPAA